MTIDKKKLGEKGELIVAKNCHCPKCKRLGTFKRLPINYKCADIICDFCGYLAQVKTCSTTKIDVLPNKILGAAWGVQKSRMDSSIYFPLYIVLINDIEQYSVFFLSTDLQPLDMFIARNPLSGTAKRAGWQGFYYDLTKVKAGAIIRLF